MQKNKGIKSKLLLIIGIIILLVGILLIFMEPIKNYMRNQKIKDAVKNFNSDSLTYVVPANGNEVNGEEYDILYDNTEEGRQKYEEAMKNLPKNVTLKYVGIINIDSVGINIPIWDSSSLVALRYGAGKYEDSVYPGEVGNCSILGHRMLAEGSLFHALGDVEIGDIVQITSIDGNNYVYVIDEIKKVLPADLIDNIKGDITTTKQLTLVTCTPMGNATHRLLVIGHLVEDKN